MSQAQICEHSQDDARHKKNNQSDEIINKIFLCAPSHCVPTEKENNIAIYFNWPLINWFNKELKGRLDASALSETEKKMVLENAQEYAVIKTSMWLTKIAIYEINVARKNGDIFGDTPEKRLTNFLTHLQESVNIKRIYNQYKPLMLRSYRHLSLFINYLSASLEHLNKDLGILKDKQFINGNLKKVSIGQGDSHFGAKQVILYEFETGGVAYKPRSLAVDNLYKNIIKQFNQYSNKHLSVTSNIDREFYSWQKLEKDEQSVGQDAAENYYYSIGVHLALVKNFLITDLHYDNVLTTITGDPIFYDLETAFFNKNTNAHEQSFKANCQAQKDLVNKLRYAVTANGILPISSQKYAGLNAMTGVNSRDSLMKVDTISNADRDDITISKETIAMEIQSRLPIINGKRTDPKDFIEVIYQGFDKAYDFLLDNRETIHKFVKDNKDIVIRHVIRDTSLYAMFLMESTHPKYASDDEALQQLFGKLAIQVEYEPEVKFTLEDEIFQLNQFDVPAFQTTIDSKLLQGYKTKNIPFYQQTGYERFSKILFDNDAADRHLQKILIARTLGCSADKNPAISHKKLSATTNNSLNNTINTLIHALEQQKFSASSDNSATWLFIAPPEESGELLPMGVDLYNGLSGMLIAYSGFYHGGYAKEASQSYFSLKETIYSNLIEDYDEISDSGLFKSIEGMILALLYVAELENDQQQQAVLLERCLSVFQSADNNNLDIISGTAGNLLLICRLFAHTNDKSLLKIGNSLSDHLLNTYFKQQHGIAWKTSHGNALCSYSHGACGIAHALCSYGKLTGQEQYITTGLSAFEYEDSLYDSEAKNWPDLRPETASRFNVTWCNGLTGFILARGMHLDILPVATKKKVQSSINGLLDISSYMDESLCHGTVGALDVLATLHKYQPELVTTTLLEEMAGNIINLPSMRSGFTFDPGALGLMTGLAGIIYGLLRVNNPHLPSILSIYEP